MGGRSGAAILWWVAVKGHAVCFFLFSLLRFFAPLSPPTPFSFDPKSTMSSPYDAMHVDATTLKLYLNGQWVESTSGKTVQINNPASPDGTDAAFKVQGKCSRKGDAG